MIFCIVFTAVVIVTVPLSVCYDWLGDVVLRVVLLLGLVLRIPEIVLHVDISIIAGQGLVVLLDEKALTLLLLAFAVDAVSYGCDN